MIERLANVMYWAACGVAVLTVVIGLPIAANKWTPFVLGLLVWLIGLALRYLLSNKGLKP
jgi:xanthine/uracil permease